MTECVGGSRVPDEAALTRRYTSLCDPRLNNEQALLMVESLPASFGFAALRAVSDGVEKRGEARRADESARRATGLPAPVGAPD